MGFTNDGGADDELAGWDGVTRCPGLPPGRTWQEEPYGHGKEPESLPDWTSPVS